MKTITKIISLFALSFFMLNSMNGISQSQVECKPNPEEYHELTIPDEIKSRSMETAVTISKYQEIVEGCILIDFDEEGKIVKVVAPNHIEINHLRVAVPDPQELLDCFDECVDGGSESEAWLCYYLCVIATW